VLNQKEVRQVIFFAVSFYINLINKIKLKLFSGQYLIGGKHQIGGQAFHFSG